MDWTPVLAIGSLITAFFTAWRWGIDPYLERRRRKHLEKKKAIKSKIEKYRGCKGSISFSIKNRILKHRPKNSDCVIYQCSIN